MARHDWVSRCERLLPVVVEFAQRVQRGDDPDGVRDWLLERTDEADRWALLWMQAAAGQTSPRAFAQRAGWCRLVEVVDEVAAWRAMRGDKTVAARLTPAERGIAVRAMSRAGVPLREIADRLDVSWRTVRRDMSHRPQPAAGGVA